MSAPLSNVRVLDLTVSVAGPYSSMLLSDLGAEVIKVEPPSGDISRKWGPPFVQDDASAYFYALNRNKKSVCLDLKKLEDKKALTFLIKQSDILIESFRPGVMARLGFSWEDAHKINPNLIYCSITGYGQAGPSSDEPAFDLMIQARSGLMSVTGEPNNPPTKIGIPIVDLVTGIYAAYAIAAAISKRSREGEGCWIDISMLDSAFSLLCYWVTGYSITGNQLPREGNGHPTMVPYQTFEAKDGAVAISASDARQWQRFTEALNRNDLVDDPRFRDNPSRVGHRKELVDIIQGMLSNYDRDNLVALMREYGVPASHVQSVRDVLGDPQLLHRQMIQDINGVIVPGCPIKMTGFSWELKNPPPSLGQHRREILQNLGIVRTAMKEGP